MKCPYRNHAKESGCDLVDELNGIRGVFAREFCDYRDCQECPLFQEALQENLEEWSELPDNEKLAVTGKKVEGRATPVPGFWNLARERRGYVP